MCGSKNVLFMIIKNFGGKNMRVMVGLLLLIFLKE